MMCSPVLPPPAYALPKEEAIQKMAEHLVHPPTGNPLRNMDSLKEEMDKRWGPGDKPERQDWWKV